MNNDNPMIENTSCVPVGPELLDILAEIIAFDIMRNYEANSREGTGA